MNHLHIINRHHLFPFRTFMSCQPLSYRHNTPPFQTTLIVLSLVLLMGCTQLVIILSTLLWANGHSYLLAQFVNSIARKGPKITDICHAATIHHSYQFLLVYIYTYSFWSNPFFIFSLWHVLGPLHTRAKSHDHEIVKAQKKVSKGRPKSLPKSCNVVMDPRV